MPTLSTISLSLLWALTGPAFAGDNSPSPMAGSYSCSSVVCDCSIFSGDCIDMIKESVCILPSGVPTKDLEDRLQDGWLLSDYLTCDSTTGTCSCPRAPDRLRLIERDHAESVGAGDVLAPGTANFDEADALFGQRIAFVTVHPDALTEERDRVVDHREEGQTRDHRHNSDENRRDHRSPDAQTRRNETVPARRAILTAPSELVLDTVHSSGLTFSWWDSSTVEQGVYVERGIPTEARGGINYHWKQVFAVEE
ncbi:MAG: hypothetical protein ACI8RZ_004277, partial [Myxococcota bacterium]